MDHKYVKIKVYYQFLSYQMMHKLVLKVRELFSESSLNYKAESVSILDGSDEGVYMWVSYNHS